MLKVTALSNCADVHGCLLVNDSPPHKAKQLLKKYHSYITDKWIQASKI